MVSSDTSFPQPIRTAAKNIISAQPGPTRFAVSRCSDMMSAFLCFFPPPIERIIENTNRYGRVKFSDKLTDIDEDTLRAYIAVLILAGVYRYVHFCFTYSVKYLTSIKIIYGSGKNEDVHSLFDASFGLPIFHSIMSEGTFHMITSALPFDNVSTRRQICSYS